MALENTVEDYHKQQNRAAAYNPPATFGETVDHLVSKDSNP